MSPMPSALPQRHQNIVEELDLMLRACHPLIYIVGAEEEPIQEVLVRVAERSRQLFCGD
jgi:hypothetical protein